MKKWIKILLGATLGVYLGSVIWAWVDFRTHPDLYVVASAPWYTQVLVNSVLCAGILLAEGLAYWLVCRRIKKGEAQPR